MVASDGFLEKLPSSCASRRRSWLPLLFAVMGLEVVVLKALWARDPLVANRAYYRSESLRQARLRAEIERNDLPLGQAAPPLRVTPVVGNAAPLVGDGKALALLFVRSCSG